MAHFVPALIIYSSSGFAGTDLTWLPVQDYPYSEVLFPGSVYYGISQVSQLMRSIFIILTLILKTAL